MKNKNIFLTLLMVVFLSTTAFQVFNTSMKITVLNELGNVEEGAAVILYDTEDDYRNEKNALTKVIFTNAKGQVKFKELESKAYFVSVVKGDKNNDGAGVQTAKLQEGKLNKLNIVIE